MHSLLWYWRTLPKRAAHFARQHAPGARFFIFGHIHRAGIWHFDDLTVINTGCWHFPFRPRVVVIDRARLGVWPVRNSRTDACHLGDQPLAEYELAPRPARNRRAA